MAAKDKPRINLTLTYGKLGRQEQFKTKEDAQQRQAELQEVMKQIKADIDAYHSYAWQTKDYYADEWLLSAERALNEHRILHQELSRVIGQFGTIEREGINIDQAEVFDVIAYVKLHGRIGVEQNFPNDVQECEALAYQVLKDIASIKDQIKRAIIKAKSGNGYSNPKWFTSANKALSIKQATHQALQPYTAKLRRDKKNQSGILFERAFVDAAYELLSKENFSQIKSRAHELMRSVREVPPAAAS